MNGHLPRVPLQSSLSANDEGDNNVTMRIAHKSRVIYLTDEENLRKPQLWDEDCANSHYLKWDPLPPNELSSII